MLQEPGAVGNCCLAHFLLPFHSLLKALACQLDDLSPLAREWGLWAVRNLCAAILKHVEPPNRLGPSIPDEEQHPFMCSTSSAQLGSTHACALISQHVLSRAGLEIPALMRNSARSCAGWPMQAAWLCRSASSNYSLSSHR
eukprot:scaffold146910_cov22-Tisochrysis_lutea.AAC.1